VAQTRADLPELQIATELGRPDSALQGAVAAGVIATCVHMIEATKAGHRPGCQSVCGCAADLLTQATGTDAGVDPAVRN
jgi:hypothetical protein